MPGIEDLFLRCFEKVRGHGENDGFALIFPKIKKAIEIVHSYPNFHTIEPNLFQVIEIARGIGKEKKITFFFNLISKVKTETVKKREKFLICCKSNPRFSSTCSVFARAEFPNFLALRTSWRAERMVPCAHAAPFV